MSDTEEKKKGRSAAIVLCYLDKNTRIVASEHSFTVQERHKAKDQEMWVGKYFYSEVGDAVRGFVRHALRKPEVVSKLDGSIQSLVNKITELETVIQAVTVRINAEIAEHEKDPVEAAMLKSE